MKALLRIHYNAPTTLTFSLLACGVFILNTLLAGGLNAFISLSPDFHFSSLSWYISLFTYPLAHANTAHLFGNLAFILLLGPIIEEKYGSRNLIYMMGITALLTALLNILFFPTGLLGASGIAFMLIVLASFANTQKGRIPLTFILVLLIYVGKEVADSFAQDNISQFAHIIGGLCGALFGFSPMMLKGRKATEV